jgi:hypothetical protein
MVCRFCQRCREGRLQNIAKSACCTALLKDSISWILDDLVLFRMAVLIFRYVFISRGTDVQEA